MPRFIICERDKKYIFLIKQIESVLLILILYQWKSMVNLIFNKILRVFFWFGNKECKISSLLLNTNLEVLASIVFIKNNKSTSKVPIFVPGWQITLQEVCHPTKAHSWAWNICLSLGFGFALRSWLFELEDSWFIWKMWLCLFLICMTTPWPNCGFQQVWTSVTQSWQNDHLYSPCKP